jgi:FKBP-type peptidyl-prolyl cis-trans isomerase 2
MQLIDTQGRVFKVHEMGDKEITLDANHELAGKNLIFDITVTDIQ